MLVQFDVFTYGEIADKLNAWNMNPISRLRIRARWLGLRFSTELPLSTYPPPVGVSSNPRMESSVDLPHPEGPIWKRTPPVLYRGVYR